MTVKKDSSGRGIKSILLGIVVAAAMLGGYYVLSYTPINKKIESTLVIVAAKEKALKTVRTQAPLLKPMTEKVKLLEQQLEVYRAKIAEKGEVISLIKTIEGEAQRLGLKVIKVNTRTVLPPPSTDESASGGKEAPPEQPPAYAKLILNSNVQAGYYKLADFLGTLQDLESFVVIESIDVTNNGEAGPELTLNLEMSLYSKTGIDNTYVAKKE